MNSRSRTARRTVVAALLALAVILVVLLATPVGLRLGLHYGGRAMEDATGLSLSVESARGSIATGLRLEGATLTGSDGFVLFEADSIGARVSLPALARHRVNIEPLRVSGATLALEMGPDGRLRGLELSEPDTSSTPASVWTFYADARLSDIAVSYTDTARGVKASVDRLDASVKGGVDDFECGLSCQASFLGRSMARAAGASVSASLSGGDGAVTLERLDVVGEGTSIAAAGRFEVAPGDTQAASFEVEMRGDADVADVAALFGESAGGRVSFSGDASGGGDGPRYSLSARAESLSYDAFEVARMDADVAGTGETLTIRALNAELLDGSVTASGRMGPTGAARSDAGSFRLPALALDLSAESLSVAALMDALGADGLAVDARVDLALIAELPAGLGADVDLTGAKAGVRIESASVGVDTLALGPLEIRAALRGPAFTAGGSCCGASFVASGNVSGSGVDGLAAEVDVPDLERTASALGAGGLSGSLHASARSVAGERRPSFLIDALSPDLRLGPVVAGPLEASVRTRGGAVSGRVSAFGGSVLATGSLEETGLYSAEMKVDDFDFAGVLPDSLPGVGSLRGTASGRASVTGSTAGDYLVDGVIDDLAVGVSDGILELVEPFEFRARPDSVHVGGARLAGDVGALYVGGTVDLGGDLDLKAEIERLDLAAASALFEAGRGRNVKGNVEGNLALTGMSSEPSLGVELSARGLEAETVRVDSLTLSARSDADRLEGSLVLASGAGGSLEAAFMVPVERDTATLIRVDPAREFACSATFDDLTFEAGPLFMPQLGGTKSAAVSGEAELSGRAGDAGSLSGSGRFQTLGVDLDLVALRLTDPLSVRIEKGDVSFDELSVAVVKRRTLGDDSGGMLRASGSVKRDGTVALLGRCESLDVGHILKAVGRQGVTPFEGRLDALAAARGSLRSPVFEFDATVAEPRVAGFGLDGITARGRMEEQTLTLEEAQVLVREEVVRAYGTVVLAPAEGEPEAADEGGDRSPSLNVRIEADDFDLKKLRKLPPAVERLEGLLNIDARVVGSAAAPELEGTASLSKGRLGMAALSEDIKDIQATLVAGDGLISLAGARARLGGGSVEASGFVSIGGGSDEPFWVTVDLDRAEVDVRGTAGVRASGRLQWGGVARGSRVFGDVEIEDAEVGYRVGLADLMSRRARRLRIVNPGDPRSNIVLDFDVNISDRVRVRSNLANLDLEGGVHVGGTALRPSLGGGVYAGGGTITYLKHDFDVESLSVSYIDPRRTDPYVILVGSTEVESRDEQVYFVTVRFEGFLYDAMPVLTSSPSLGEPDIVALLTFGDTVGGLIDGSPKSGSSGESFSGLARKAFIGGVSGVAASTLERLLRLDKVALEEGEESVDGTTDMNVTVGKGIGDRLQVSYTTALGRFADQSVEISFKLAERVFIDTRSGQDGNHAIDIRLRLPFR